MKLWVPPTVSAELRASTLEHQAEVMAQAKTDATLDYWTRELRRIDPQLSLIKAHPDATEAGLKPGFWHILRENPGAPCSLIPVEGPNGEYREPDSGLYDLLRRNDLWSDQARQDRERMRRDAREAELKRRDREREARQEELKERVRAVTETSVSMTRARPWTQNVSGRHE